LSPFLNKGITEAKQVTSVTFADISKAFDTVWVKALLYKLGKYGIKGDLLCWLKSYFSNRPYLPSLYKSAFTQTVSNALLISANVTLVTCFASNASNIV
jgi:hypothetical protein